MDQEHQGQLDFRLFFLITNYKNYEGNILALTTVTYQHARIQIVNIHLEGLFVLVISQDVMQ